MLTCIAYHDRGGYNERHCDAAFERLAAETKLHLTTVKQTVTELRALGYIGSMQHPADKRRRILWIIYDEDIGSQLTTETGEIGSQVGSQLATKSVASQNSHVAENIQLSESNRVLNRKNRFLIDSVETGSLADGERTHALKAEEEGKNAQQDECPATNGEPLTAPIFTDERLEERESKSAEYWVARGKEENPL
jgi:hypothetical protein